MLMFLLSVLLDLTDELDVFCRSFPTQITSASLYSILTYQIRYPPAYRGYSIFNFPLFLPMKQNSKAKQGQPILSMFLLIERMLG